MYVLWFPLHHAIPSPSSQRFLLPPSFRWHVWDNDVTDYIDTGLWLRFWLVLIATFLKTLIIGAKWRSLDMNTELEIICLREFGSMSKRKI
jgi:hypothetical protein